MGKGFWKTFWGNYCEVTHFHGFREMYMIENPWNKAYWISAIIYGFIFSFVLVAYGILNNTEDPVSTLVTTTRDGTLSLDVLLCPSYWMDARKMAKYKSTKVEVYYALTYLKRYAIHIGMPESYLVPLKYFSGSNWEAEPDWNAFAQMDFRFLLASIQDFVGHSPVPDNHHYSDFTRQLFLQIKKKGGYLEYGNEMTSDRFQNYLTERRVFENLYLIILQQYLSNQTDALFDTLYRYLPIGSFNKTNQLKANQTEIVFADLPTNLPRGDFNSTLQDLYWNAKPNFTYRTHLMECPFTYKALVETQLMNDTFQAKMIDKAILKNNLSGFECFTMELLDKIDHAVSTDPSLEEMWKVIDSINCSETFERLVELQRKTQMINPKRFWIERLLTLVFHLGNKPQDLHRSDGILETMKEDAKFGAFLQKYKAEGTRGALAEYLMEVPEAKEEFSRLLKDADVKFQNSEKNRFSKFLTDNNFTTPYEFLEAISVDLNRFVAWISEDSRQLIWPKDATIESGKRLTELGVCMNLSVKVPPNVEQNIMAGEKTHVLNVVSFNSQGAQTKQGMSNTYLSIMPTFNSTSDDTIKLDYGTYLAFGSAVNDFYPTQRLIQSSSTKDYHKVHQYYKVNEAQTATFRVGEAEDYESTKQWERNYVNFEVSSLEYQQKVSRKNAPCKHQDPKEAFYTYNNCVYKCDNLHRHPKHFTTLPDTLENWRRIDIPVPCYFGLSVTDADRSEFLKLGMTECSHFILAEALLSSMENNTLLIRPFSKLVSNRDPEIIPCVKACMEPCSSEAMHVQKSFHSDGGSLIQRTWEERLIEFEHDFTNNTRPETDLKLMKVSFSEMDDYLERNHLSAGLRFQVEINSDSITYREKETFTWDSMFGIVGGQIGLVTGASCLTLIQLFWVIIRTVFHLVRQNRMRSVSMNHEGVDVNGNDKL